MGMGWSFFSDKAGILRTYTKSGLKPEVRAPSFSSTKSPEPSIPIMGIITSLGLLLVSGAVVGGAAMWRKEHSGREGREGSEFSCLSWGFKPR